MAAISSIVDLIGRLHVIQDSKFISAGYALVDGMVLLVFLLMTTSNWPFDSPDTFGEGIAYTVVAGYIYSYIRILIGDLESPFDYAEDYCSKCYKAGRLLGYSGPGPDDKEQTWFSRLRGEFEFGGSLKGTAMLTVVFGTQLKQLIKKAQSYDAAATGNGADAEGNEETKIQAGRTGARLPFFKHKPYRQANKSLRKWRLVIRSLPFVVALVGCRLAVWYGAGIGGWIDSPQLFTSFIRLVIFVSSVVIQGLMQDYKESERMPSELVTAFYSVTTTSMLCTRWANSLKSLNSAKVGDESFELELASDKESLLTVENFLRTILEAIEDMSSHTGNHVCKEGYVKAMTKITKFDTEMFRQVMKIEKLVEHLKKKEVNLVYKLDPPVKQLSSLRYIIARIYVIQSTGYLAEAYTLMDLMVLWIFGVLTATYWPLSLVADGVPAAAAFTVVIPFLFTYLELFVRNIENPFDYPKGHLKRCYDKHGRALLCISDEQRYGGSIDMSPLTVGFGRLLREKLAEVDTYNPTENTDPDMKINCYTVNEASSWCNGLPTFIQLLRRFRLVLQTLPFILVMVCLRLVVWYGAGVGGWIDPSVPLSFVGVAIFVTGFLLQAVIQDYRDAEKLPCQVAVALKGLEAVTQGGCAEGQASESREAYHAMESLLKVGLEVFEMQESSESTNENSENKYKKELLKINDSIHSICKSFSNLKSKDLKRKIFEAGWEAMSIVSDIRRALLRTRQLKEENFTLDGYTLNDTIVLAVCILLTLTDWPKETYSGTAMGASIVISGLFIYMALLIRSLENPFKYPPDHLSEALTGNAKGSDDFTACQALDCGNPVDLSVFTSLVKELFELCECRNQATQVARSLEKECSSQTACLHTTVSSSYEIENSDNFCFAFPLPVRQYITPISSERPAAASEQLRLRAQMNEPPPERTDMGTYLADDAAGVKTKMTGDLVTVLLAGKA